MARAPSYLFSMIPTTAFLQHSESVKIKKSIYVTPLPKPLLCVPSQSKSQQRSLQLLFAPSALSVSFLTYSPVFILLQPHCSPSCSWNMPGLPPPLGLCICCSPSWNALPPEIYMAPSLTSFRPLLKCEFLSEAFPDHSMYNCNSFHPHPLPCFICIFSTALICTQHTIYFLTYCLRRQSLSQST